nr:ribonuclease H-like domain-containing protein [Tanacetum cinerariifolium]
MIYEPVSAGNQTNNDAGIEINANARKTKQEKASDHEYILLPFMPLSTHSSNDKDAGDVPDKGDEGPIINTTGTNINIGSLNINTVGSNDPSMPSLEETGIFDDVYNDREVGAEANTNSLELSTVVSLILTTRVPKDHPKEHIIGDLNIETQKRRMLNFSKENAMNKTLIEAARTMLADSLLPTTFWAEAVSTACYVQNRVLVTKPHNKTPYELLIGRTPNLDFMKPFGSHVTILNTLDHLGKFEGKADEGFLVGYSINSKAFKSSNDKDAGDVPDKGDEGVSKRSGIDDQEKTDSSTQDVGPTKPIINTTGTNINISSLNINTVGSNDPSMPSLEETGIFDDVYNDREVGAEANTNSLELSTV